MTIDANKAEKLADGADERTQKGVREAAWEMVKEADAIKNFFEPSEDGGEAA